MLATSALIGLSTVREIPVGPASTAVLFLVYLPCLGLASLFPRRSLGLGVALWIWPLVLLAGLPLYFPGERADALRSGVAQLSSLGGESFQTRCNNLALKVTTWMGEESPGETPPERAVLREEPTDTPPPRQLPTDDAASLPYEGDSHQRRVAVVLEGPGGRSVETWMLFDTGASLTTLSPQVLADIGIRTSPDAPILEFLTANGRREDPVALVDRLWLAGLPVEGVTVAACEACASDSTSGLLGLNVSGLFQVTLDPQRKEIGLEPRLDQPDRKSDISPWLKLGGTFHSWSDGRLEIDIQAENLSTRDIRDLELDIHCDEHVFQTILGDLHAGEERQKRVGLPWGSQCEVGGVAVGTAYW